MPSDADVLAEIFENVSLGSPQNAIGFVMWRVVHRYVREVDRVLKPLDLTHLQFTTLTLIAWIARDEKSSTQSELARFGDIHPMQISNVLKALEVKGMVERSPAPGNALAKQVAITSVGITAVRNAFPPVIAVQGRLFGERGRPGGALLDLLVQVEQAT